MSGGTGADLFKMETELVKEKVAAIEASGGFSDIAINAQAIATDLVAAADALALLPPNTSPAFMGSGKIADAAGFEPLITNLTQHQADFIAYGKKIAKVVLGTSADTTAFPDEDGLKNIVEAKGGASTDEYAQTIKAIMGTDPTVFQQTSCTNGSLVDKLILRHSVAQLAEGSEVVANRNAEFPWSYYNGDSVLDTTWSYASVADGDFMVGDLDGGKTSLMQAAGANGTIQYTEGSEIVKIPDISWTYNKNPSAPPTAGATAGAAVLGAWKWMTSRLDVINNAGTFQNAAYTTTEENVVSRYKLFLTLQSDYMHMFGADPHEPNKDKWVMWQPPGFSDFAWNFFYEFHKKVWGLESTIPQQQVGFQLDSITKDVSYLVSITGVVGGHITEGGTEAYFTWQGYKQYLKDTQSATGTAQDTTHPIAAGADAMAVEKTLRYRWAEYVGSAAPSDMSFATLGRRTNFKSVVDMFGSAPNVETISGAPSKWGPKHAANQDGKKAPNFADRRQGGALDQQAFYAHSENPFTEFCKYGNFFGVSSVAGCISDWAWRVRAWQRYNETDPTSAAAQFFSVLRMRKTTTKLLEKKGYHTTWYPAYMEYVAQLKKLRQEIMKLYKLNSDMVAAMMVLEVATLEEGAAVGLNEEEKAALAKAEAIIEALKDGDFTIASTGFNKRMKFKEQCYLLANIFSFVDGSTYEKTSRSCSEDRHKWWPLQVLMVDSIQSYGFLNRLVMDGHQSAYYEMTPADISTLQPMIRLYKVEYNKETKEEYETLMSFETTTTLPSDALAARLTRGAGVGVKSFNFTYDGSNPFAAKKSIKATLKIHAANFDELMKERMRWSAQLGKSIPYRYIDLALKTGGQDKKEKCDVKKEQNVNLAKLNFRLKAVVGWASGRGASKTYLQDMARRNAIDNSYVTLNLTPTVHDFTFNQDGSVVFTINYLAYIDDYFDQNNFNIFANYNVLMASTIREIGLKTAKSQCLKETPNYKEKLGEKISKQKQESIQEVVKALLETNKIHYAEYGYDQIRNFMSKGPFAEGSTGKVPKVRGQSSSEARRAAAAQALKTGYVSSAGYSAASSNVKNQIAAALTVVDPNAVYIPFFYAADLINVITTMINLGLAKVSKNLQKQVKLATSGDLIDNDYYGMKFKIDQCYVDLKLEELRRQSENFRKLRIILGPCEIVNHASPSAQVAIQSKTVNFGKLPISVKYFVEFLTERMASKDRVVYPLGKFINDFFNNLVRNFLNDDTCFLYPVKQKTIMNQSAITGYRSSKTFADPITEKMCKKAKKSPRQIDVEAVQGAFNLSGPPGRTHGGLDQEINYMIYNAGRSQPKELMNGNKAEDAERGVYHYQVGSRKGMIKEISLSKTQSTGLAEVRFEQDGYEGLKQLRVVYDVEISTYALPKTYPGVYIYVDPKGFTPSATTGHNDPMNLSEYGVGGYYMIYKSEHTFAAGQAESKLYAKWVAQLAAAATDEIQKSAIGDGEDRNAKCEG